MAKRNYSKYSEKNEQITDVVIENVDTPTDEVVVENAAPEIDLVEETVETVAIPEIVVGTVINCAKLNVRETPATTAAVVAVLDVASEIKINVAKSNGEWVNVCTATGIEGYCMRKFVNANL